MRPFPDFSSMARCEVCGSWVPVENLSEHFLADARTLQLINANNPAWDQQECEEYFRALCGTEKLRERD